MAGLDTQGPTPRTGCTQMDMESLQHSGRRRWSRLDLCLVMSIFVLFLAVTAVAVVVALIVMKTPQSTFLATRGESSNHGDKVQNYAYLAAKPSGLKNSTMVWSQVQYLDTKSVGSNFEFNENQSYLKPKNVGYYFLFIKLNFTCIFECGEGLLTVQVGNMLTCSVNFTAKSMDTHMTEECWTVGYAGEEELYTQMRVLKNGLENWRLEATGSGLGMFSVG